MAKAPAPVTWPPRDSAAWEILAMLRCARSPERLALASFEAKHKEKQLALKRLLSPWHAARVIDFTSTRTAGKVDWFVVASFRLDQLPPLSAEDVAYLETLYPKTTEASQVPAHTLVTGSFQASVVKLFHRMPDEEYTQQDLSLKFGVFPHMVPDMLAGEVAAGVLTRLFNTVPTWAAGPRLNEVVFRDAADGAADNARKRKSPDVPDASLVTIGQGVRLPVDPPKPPKPKKPGWDDIFDKLHEPGMHAELDARYRHTAIAAAMRRKKLRDERYTVRLITPALIGIWRLNDDGSIPDCIDPEKAPVAA